MCVCGEEKIECVKEDEWKGVSETEEGKREREG